MVEHRLALESESPPFDVPRQGPTLTVGIASGKGGVGKTTIATNLAVALQQLGASVVLVDADLGLANAQLALGLRTPWNLSHVLSGEKTLSDIRIPVRPGLDLIAGASGLHHLAALDAAQAKALMRQLTALDPAPQFQILDMAAGLSPTVLQCMAACQRRLVVVKDDPASVADAYGIIKVMHHDLGLTGIELVCNQVQNPSHGRQLHQRLAEVCTRFLGLTLHHLGSIEQDEWVVESQRRYQPVVDCAPGSAAARDLRRLADSLQHPATADSPAPALPALPAGVQP